MTLIYSRTCKHKRLYVLWIDLRTAFPSLNRSFLLHRLFKCGFGVGMCRLLLAVFDVTISAVVNARCISEHFLETRGTREGSVEAPHQFNVYISALRLRLEAEHPRLCKLMFVTIAVLRYAEDAGGPRNKCKDLRGIMQRLPSVYCNIQDFLDNFPPRIRQWSPI